METIVKILIPLIPFLAAGLAILYKDKGLPRKLGLFFSLLAGGSIFFISTYGLSALLLASILSTIGCTVLASETDWRDGGAFRIFLIQGCTFAMAFSSNPIWVCVLWMVAPLAVLMRGLSFTQWKWRSAFFFYQLVSSGLFILATILWTTQRDSQLCGILFALAAWIRLGAFPFHASSLCLSEETSLTTVVPFLSSQMGAIGLLHLTAPLTLSQDWARIITGVHAFGALYMALLATVQTEPRRLSIFLSVMGTSLALAGFFGGGGIPLPGSSLQWLTVGLITSGLGCTTWLLFERVGGAKGGLAYSLPAFGGFFLLFGLAAVAFPGTLGFISGDLILGTLISRNVIYGALVLVAFALSTIAAYRVYVGVFQGTPQLKAPGIDVSLRERIGFIFLVASVVLTAIAGRPLTDWMGSRGERLVFSASTTPKEGTESHGKSTRTHSPYHPDSSG